MTRSKPRPTLILTLAMAGLGLGMVSASNASAAEFKISATGTFSGPQTSDQVFTVSSGSFTCETAWSSLTTISSDFSRLDGRVDYSNCKASYFGYNMSASVSHAQLTLWANGKVDLNNTITMEIPAFGCSVSFPQQAGLESVSYTNKYPGVEPSLALTGATYSANGLCGSSGANGTFTGSSLIERVGGGTIQWIG